MIEVAIVLIVVWGAHPGIPLPRLDLPGNQSEAPIDAREEMAPSLADEILAAAKIGAALATPYRMSYPTIAYPGGDVSSNEGLCCDVVVRSLRAAGIDLQELVYEDSLAARELYLEVAGRTAFDRPLNRSWIHRRTATLNLFFSRHALSLPTRYTEETRETWQPGDIVVYIRNGWETWHIAIISDATDAFTGEPMVIDSWRNPGYVSERHRLTAHGSIAGHYWIPDSLREGLSPEHVELAISAWSAYVTATASAGVASGPPPAYAPFASSPVSRNFSPSLLFGF